MKPLPHGGAGKRVAGGGQIEEAADLARPERPPPQARVVEREREYSDEDEEDVLAGGGAVGARARRRGGDVDGVDVSGGAEDEEEGVGAVEEAEAVADGADDAVGEGLGGVEAVALLRRGAVVVGWGGTGPDGFHERES